MLLPSSHSNDPNDGCGPRCAPEFCGDGFLTGVEQCDDGNSSDGDGCSAGCLIEGVLGEVTQDGTIIAAVTAPLGGGNPDIEVIRDGDKPPVGSGDSSRQYDTWDDGDPAAEDWVGYEFITDYAFSRIVFEEGRQFWDVGWFDSLTVQIRQGGVWVEARNVSFTPTNAGENGLGYETFDIASQTTGDAIRVYGDPGGAASLIRLPSCLCSAPPLACPGATRKPD